MAELVIYHQNLHKSLLPTQKLLHKSGLNTGKPTERKITLLCVQEPNTSRNSVIGFGLNNHVYVSGNNTSDGGERRRAALVANCNNVMKLEQFCSSDRVVFCVDFHGQEIYVCNIYCDPKREFRQVLNEFQSICLLVTGDINAKHCAWNSPVDDIKGKLFFDFVVSNNLIILIMVTN
jgi:hypothetical protein